MGVWAGTLFLAGCTTLSEAPPSQPVVRQHADASFEKLRQEEQQGKQPEQPQDKQAELSQLKLPVAQVPDPQPQPSDDQYLTATGHGDLTKGPLICQRVADTAARAELAKLIRVTIKEQAIHRARERTGKPFEQDIEVVREELVNELLQEVKIVDRKVDSSAGTCSSTAVMPRRNLIPLSPPSLPQGER
ncbi:MAG: hypothetical protein ACREJ6_12250 [Candidatus Methylomirabilis sp.]